jgi:hypothetical protein
MAARSTAGLPGGIVATGLWGAGAQATTGRAEAPSEGRGAPSGGRAIRSAASLVAPSAARPSPALARAASSGGERGLGQRPDAAQRRGRERDLGQVLDQLEAQERLLEVSAPGDDAVAAEQDRVDGLAPRGQGRDRRFAGGREADPGDDRAERHHRLGDERPRDRMVGDAAGAAGDRGGRHRVGVDHGADVGPALVDREVQAELAEDLALADHLAGGVEGEDVALGDHPLRGRGRRGEEPAAVAGR